MKKKTTSTKSRIYKADKLIRAMLKEHGKVRVVFSDVRVSAIAQKEEDLSLRRRIMTKEGKSRVSYKGSGYEKWTGYSSSCFVENATKKPDEPKKLVKLMRAHDGQWLEPIEIHYGWFFRKKVKIHE